MATPTTEIPGYDYDRASAERGGSTTAITLDDLAELQADVMLTSDDVACLRRCGELLEDQVEEVLDVWYGFVASQPHLVVQFADADGQPIPDYLARVRPRFGQWIRDTCARPYDEQWLSYQEEIAARHTEVAKNLTDGVTSTPLVPARHVIALIVPIATTVRPFLAARAEPADDIDALLAAWLKAVVLQVALWSRAYVGAGRW